MKTILGILLLSFVVFSRIHVSGRVETINGSLPKNTTVRLKVAKLSAPVVNKYFVISGTEVTGTVLQNIKVGITDNIDVINLSGRNVFSGSMYKAKKILSKGYYTVRCNGKTFRMINGAINKQYSVNSQVVAVSRSVVYDTLVIESDSIVYNEIALTTIDTSGVVFIVHRIYGYYIDYEGNRYKTVKIGDYEFTSEPIRSRLNSMGGKILESKTALEWVKNKDLTNYIVVNNNFYYNKVPSSLGGGTWFATGKARIEWLINYSIANGGNWDTSHVGNKIGSALSAQYGWWYSGKKGTVGYGNLQYNNSSAMFNLSIHASGYVNALGELTNISWMGGMLAGDCVFYSKHDSESAILAQNEEFKYCGFPIRMVRKIQ